MLRIVLKKSEIIAKTNQLKGETDAKAKFLTENEKAKGELLKARAVGDGALLSQMVMVNALNPKVKTRIIHAGPGTLWTDLKGPALALPSSAAPKAAKTTKAAGVE